MLKQLYYGSLQDHMRASRREMDRSYVLQQQQLMRMNVMRESQRMMLTQAETIVRLNQLRDEVIKALPPKNVKVVIPTSNAALEETLSRSKQTQVTMEEEVEGKRAPPTKGTQTQVVMEEEGKRAPPTKVRSAPASLAGSPKQRNLMVEVEQAVKNKLSPRQVKAAADAAKAANKPSPTASQAPTVNSSIDTATSDPETPTRYKQKLDNLKAQVKILDYKLLENRIPTPSNISNARSILSSGNTDKVETLKAAIARAEAFIKEVGRVLGIESKIAAAKDANPDVIKPAGSGLKRHRAKSGRFVKSKR